MVGKYVFVFLMCFVLYINFWGVSMRFNAIFCIYKYIKKKEFGSCLDKLEMTELPKTCCLLFVVQIKG